MITLKSMMSSSPGTTSPVGLEMAVEISYGEWIKYCNTFKYLFQFTYIIVTSQIVMREVRLNPWNDKVLKLALMLRFRIQNNRVHYHSCSRVIRKLEYDMTVGCARAEMPMKFKRAARGRFRLPLIVLPPCEKLVIFLEFWPYKHRRTADLFIQISLLHELIIYSLYLLLALLFMLLFFILI